MQRRIVTCLGILLLALCVGGVIAASSDLEINWNVVDSGGSSVRTGKYALDSSIGQAVAGEVQHDPIELCTGFLCTETSSIRYLYMPLVVQELE